MIPLKDTVPNERTPFVTRTLMLVCVAVYMYQVALSFQPAGPTQVVRTGDRVVRREITRNDLFVQRWGAAPRQVLSGRTRVTMTLGPTFFSRQVQYEERLPLSRRLGPLLTSLFLHGSLLHLAMNMLFLGIFGDTVEDRLGHWRFLLFYLGGGLFASVTHVLIYFQSDAPIIGASGAISAVLGAYMLLFPRSVVITFIFFPPFLFPLPAVVFLGVWFISQLFSGFGAMFQASGGIAWWAHIGGFLFGAGITFWNYPKWRRRSGRRRAAPAAVRQSLVDRQG